MEMGIGFVLKAAAALAVLLALIAVPICSDGSDAAVPEYSAEIRIDLGEPVTIDLQDYLEGNRYNHCTYTKYSGTSELPPGITKDGSTLSGTPTELGSYHLQFRFNNASVSLVADAILNFDITVTEIPERFTVTYDAGIGTVNGQRTWTESITEDTFASLPDAKYSSGAYVFKGWSTSETSNTTVDSLKVNGDITLFAVWERQTVKVDPITATITSGQSSTMPVTTDPEDARLSISDLGGLSSYNATVSGRYIFLDMTNVEPGTYYVTISASSTGYYTGSAKVTIMVPITIVKPIEYTLSQGDVFSYTPVTNPSNASIELKSVLLDGSPVEGNGGLSVSGRTITGTLENPGTYEISYRAFLDGYVDVDNTVFVYVSDSSEIPDVGSVSLASVTASARASEPRVFDFVAIGGQNVSNYVWTVDGEVFASSSETALYEFPSSGIYTVACTARGFDGSEVTMEITVVCTDNYHREAAWSGVEYAYIVDGELTAQVPNGCFLSRTTETIDGKVFTVLSGTPSEGDIGKSYDVTVGEESWTVTVYKAEASAPTASFSVTVDGYTAKAVFTGLRASFHMFDFDGDGTFENEEEFRYDRPGRYTVVCKAVNNVSEVTSTAYVEVDIVPQEDATIDELTDFHIGVNERMHISISMGSTDALSVSGSASSFVTVDGTTLIVAPTEAGVYELIVTITHSDGTTDSKSVEVTVKQEGLDPVPEPHGDYTAAMIAIFIVSIGLIAGFLIYDTRTGKVSERYRSFKSKTRTRVRRNGSSTNQYGYRNNQNNRNNGGRWR
ncbi:hypothetical protein JS82_02290 [Methanomassiliicoccaceae archaeon DOK]|nr:hypothetical protein JS82_02290 [Methanomassiliicoccaceae archaeon DOK]